MLADYSLVNKRFGKFVVQIHNLLKLSSKVATGLRERKATKPAKAQLIRLKLHERLISSGTTQGLSSPLSSAHTFVSFCACIEKTRCSLHVAWPSFWVRCAYMQTQVALNEKQETELQGQKVELQELRRAVAELTTICGQKLVQLEEDGEFPRPRTSLSRFASEQFASFQLDRGLR